MRLPSFCLTVKTRGQLQVHDMQYPHSPLVTLARLMIMSPGIGSRAHTNTHTHTHTHALTYVVLATLTQLMIPDMQMCPVYRVTA